MALNLSFEDARSSQVDAGLEHLNEYGVKASLYAISNKVNKRMKQWQSLH